MSLPFLRPLALPRPSTVKYFLNTARLSTTTTTTSSASSLLGVSLPQSSANPSQADSQRKPYRINLTPSQNYPVYEIAKRGGNKKLTRIRKIDGDLAVLRQELQEALGLEGKEVVINQLTRHIIVKGHKKPEIENFFKERSL